MSYTIALSENAKYIVCRVTGSMTANIAKEFSEKLDTISHTSNIKSFLIDVRSTLNKSTHCQNYAFAYNDMKALNLQRDARSAILADPADGTHDFVETVTQNAGYNVRLFHDEPAAIEWLTKETDS